MNRIKKLKLDDFYEKKIVVCIETSTIDLKTNKIVHKSRTIENDYCSSKKIETFSKDDDDIICLGEYSPKTRSNSNIVIEKKKNVDNKNGEASGFQDAQTKSSILVQTKNSNLVQAKNTDRIEKPAKKFYRHVKKTNPVKRTLSYEIEETNVQTNFDNIEISVIDNQITKGFQKEESDKMIEYIAFNKVIFWKKLKDELNKVSATKRSERDYMHHFFNVIMCIQSDYTQANFKRYPSWLQDKINEKQIKKTSEWSIKETFEIIDAKSLTSDWKSIQNTMNSRGYNRHKDEIVERYFNCILNRKNVFALRYFSKYPEWLKEKVLDFEKI